ncbi:MAG TPA: cell wall-binding repeat-containing protein, partial [Acidimicrobiales bacterium]|nr:cell wall-binding repeat-containing protein [Acidimicrobiales bacterium]
EADGAISILDTSFFDNHAGDDDGDSGGGAVSVDGGESTITMDDVLMVENTTAGDGGAVFVGGSGGVIDIDIDDTTFQDNHAYDGHGGALSVVGTEGNLYLTGVNVSENTALGNGGGINASSAGVFVTDSLLALNTSGDEGLGGGGINVEDGALEIVNSTISGNVGELGGGVRINDSAESTIAHTTFAGNTADISGALYAEDTHVVLDHVVVASEPSAYPEISTGLGGSAEVTWSFFEHDPGAIADGTGNVVDEDPRLGDLVGDGDTAVHVPEEGSPLIDEGDPSLTADDLPELDQREEARLSGVAVDIGSVEVQQAEEEPEEPEEPEAPGGSDDDDDDDGDEEQPASAPLPRTPARRDGSAAVPDRSVAGTEGSPVRVDPPATGRETTEVSVPTAAGPVSVIVDTDAGSGSSTIAVTSTPVGETTANASGFVLLGTAFEVDVEGAAAETGGVVCFPYDDDDVAAAGLDEDELELFHFDEDGNREIVTTTRDTVSNRICGAVDSFSPFAIGDLATERLAGGTAARTAAAVSRATFDPGVPVVYVTARGADGLGAGAAAAFGNGPVLLVDRDGVPSSTERELERLRPARVVVVGGTAVVSDAVVSAVGGTRVSGADRYATAAAVSAATFPSAGTVYVASGESTPDALVASVAAAAAGAPLLLVEPDAVPATTRVEIARLGATRVVVVGGSAAVSDAVASALGATRIAGADRYATAAEVARSLGRSTVLVARGDDPVDAIAGIPAADHRGAAILLVHPDAIPAVVRDVLASLSPTAMSILGGTGAITQQNEVDLAGFLD